MSASLGFHYSSGHNRGSPATPSWARQISTIGCSRCALCGPRADGELWDGLDVCRGVEVMRRNLFVSIALLAFVLSLGGNPAAQAKDDLLLSDEERYAIKQTCTRFYSGALEIIDYYKCMSKREAEAIEAKKSYQRYEENQTRETQQRIEANRIKAARVEASRSCVNNNLPAIESKIRVSRTLIKGWDSLDRAKNILDKHFLVDGQIVASSSNSARKVYAATIALPCDTDFYFLLNVSGTESNGVASLSVWAKNALDTYRNGSLPTNGFIESFFRDFQAETKEELKSVWAAKVSVISAEIACTSSGNCYSYSIHFRLKNNAGFALKNFDFTAFFTQRNAGLNCPDNKAVIRLSDTLLPGEVRDVSFVQTNYGSNKFLPPGISSMNGMMLCFNLKKAEEAD